MKLLLVLGLLYLFVGMVITAFCVHMCYHESAAGFGDEDDSKAQRVLESKFGMLYFVLLFAFWPIAMLVAFKGAWDRMDHAAASKQTGDAEPGATNPPAAGSESTPAQPVSAKSEGSA